MEKIVFKTCEACQGAGETGGQRCQACFGAKRFFVENNNFYYWQKLINRSSILVRETREIIDLVINGLLMIGALSSVYLIYKILNQVEFDPRNLLNFLITPGRNNVWLMILIVVNMYLYYRLSIPAQKQKAIKQKLKNEQVFFKYNIAESLNQETEWILDRAWLYALRKGTWPVTVWHLLFVLLEDKDVKVVLARLGVGAQNLQQIIDQRLADLTAEDSKADMSRAEKLDLTVELKNVLLFAYHHAIKVRHSEKIEEIDLLAGLTQVSDAIRDFFYDFDIDESKVDNVIAWMDINVKLVENYRRYRGRALFKPKSGINRSYTAIATPVLNSFSEDLTLAAKSGFLPLVVARDKEIQEIIDAMESNLDSVILVGPGGTGKTNIVQAIANLMMAEDMPAIFQDKRLVSLSVPALVSGAGVQGSLEERLSVMLNEISVSGNIILFIDNIHNLVGVSSQGSEGLDLAEVLATAVASKSIVLIATTTNEDYIKYLEGKQLGQVLRKVNILETDKNQTIQILEAHVGYLENKHKIYFTYNSLEKIFDLADRYLPDQHLPQKALQILEAVALQVAKNDRQDKLVRSEDVAQYVSSVTNIPLTTISADESSKLLNLEQDIHQRVIGQDEAVKQVSTALQRARAELRDKKRPIVNLLFLGPTGVGKTELAKAVAEKYFGHEENMIRLDMSEYQNQDSLDRLLGSATANIPGLLTEAVRHKPFALLLLDEVEKAHPDILNVFLQVMEDGRLTDALGRTVDFTNLIIVATSNAGTEYIQEQIHAGRKTEDFKDDLVKNKLQGIFRPEFLNRFDGVILFKPLTEDEIFMIAGLMLNKVKQRLELKGIFFEVTPEAQAELAKAGFDPVFGARPLRRVIQEQVDNALAQFLLQGSLNRRDIVVYDVGGEIRVKKALSYKN